MKELMVVGCGGFVGAILRYVVSGWAQNLSNSHFPFGTLAVNSIGSLVIGVVLGLFQHANIDFMLGPLTWIFSVGEMHRWHHSVELAEANHNYGSNFLFWDIVFGTRYRDPRRSGPAVIGIEHDDLPTSWWAQLGAPFRPR